MLNKREAVEILNKATKEKGENIRFAINTDLMQLTLSRNITLKAKGLAWTLNFIGRGDCCEYLNYAEIKETCKENDSAIISGLRELLERNFIRVVERG